MSEATGTRERPYDMRWGTPEQVKEAFGINAATLKAAWTKGWVRARQGNWESDDRRTQTVYCFEDIHEWLERVAHRVTDEYAARWWTDAEVARLAEKTPDGPYARRAEAGPRIRKDGYPALERRRAG